MAELRAVAGFVTALLVACGGTGKSSDAGPGGAGTQSTAGGAHAASGSSSGGSATTGGSETSHGGGTSGTAGTAGDNSSSGGDPYQGLIEKPDTNQTPVASCSGQPDMTLCQVTTTPDRKYDICVGGVCVSPGCGDASCNASTPHFIIPPNSGHTYFVFHADPEPVAVDLVTGLHWQACLAGQSSATCGGVPMEVSWEDAIDYCDKLTWAGKSDWYLPDSWELLSILDWGTLGVRGAAVDPSFFPGGGNYLWTSHFSRPGSMYAEQLDVGASPATPTLVEDSTSFTHAFRCVRRGFSRDAGFAGKRFSSSSADEKVIDDPATGLSWQGCSSGATGNDCGSGQHTGIAIDSFVSQCDNLSWGGFDDWRLPTYKELHSIAQYPPIAFPGRATIPQDVFDLAAGPYLAGRTGSGADAKPLLIDASEGTPVGPTAKYPVMCVRWK